MPIKVIDIIKPLALPVGQSQFPTVEDIDILGGFQIQPTLAARNAIPSANLKVGMLVYVLANTTYYTLTSTSPTTWITANLGTATNISGDVVGPLSGATVEKIQGIAVSATAPTNQTALVYNGTTYAPSGVMTVVNILNYGAIAGGFDCSTALANAVAALPSTGGIIWIPIGEFYFSTTWDLSNKKSINIMGAGGLNPAPASSILVYTGSGSVGINFSQSYGCGLEDIQVFYTSSSFNGILVSFDSVSTSAGQGHLKRCNLTGVVSDSAVNATLVGLNRCITTVIEDCLISTGTVGIRGVLTNTLPDFSVANRIIGGAIGGVSVLCVQNPGSSWVFDNVTFEPLTNNTPGAIGTNLVAGSQLGQGVSIKGCWIGDATATGSAITVCGNGWDISGNFISGDQFSGSTCIDFINNISGFSCHGNVIADAAIAFNFHAFTLANFRIGANNFVSITTDYAGTSVPFPADLEYKIGNRYLYGTSGKNIGLLAETGIVYLEGETIDLLDPANGSPAFTFTPKNGGASLLQIQAPNLPDTSNLTIAQGTGGVQQVYLDGYAVELRTNGIRQLAALVGGECQIGQSADVTSTHIVNGSKIAFNATLVGSSGTNTPLNYGISSIVMASDANLTLSSTQYANPILRITSSLSLTATRNIVLPSTTGAKFDVYNGTTGGQSLTFIASTGTGVTIQNGLHNTIWFDGTNYVSAVSPEFNVQLFGATGNGSTDDTTAINTAISAASINGGVIYFPAVATHYLINNGPITVPTNVSIRGDGKYATTIWFQGSSTGGFIITGNNQGSFIKDIAIRGTAGVSSVMDAITLSNASGTIIMHTVYDCWMTNWRRAYICNGTEMCGIERCLITNCGNSGFAAVEVDQSSSTWHSIECFISGFSGFGPVAGYRIDRCFGAKILGGAIQGNGVPIQLGNKAENSVPTQYIKLEGVDMENPTDHYIDMGVGWTGLTAQGAINVDILNCTMSPSGATTTPYGIKIFNSEFITSRGNLIIQQSSGYVTTFAIDGYSNNIDLDICHSSSSGGTQPYVQIAGVTQNAGYAVRWSTSTPLPGLTANLPTGATPNLLFINGPITQAITNNSGATNVTNLLSETQNGRIISIMGQDGGHTTLINGSGGAGQIFTKTGSSVTINNGNIVQLMYYASSNAWYQI